MAQSQSSTPFIVRIPSEKPQAAVAFLHGAGAGVMDLIAHFWERLPQTPPRLRADLHLLLATHNIYSSPLEDATMLSHDEIRGAMLYVPKAYRADVFTLDDETALGFAKYIIAANRPSGAPAESGLFAEPDAAATPPGRRDDPRPAIEFLTGGAQAIAIMTPELLPHLARKAPAREVVNIVMQLPADAPAGRTSGVRQARESDVPVLMRWRRQYREERGLVFDADVEALVRSQRVFVYEQEGTVVAAAKLDIELATLVEIGGVFTFPPYRKHGFGGQIVQDLAARIRELGKIPLLQVDQTNAGALHLYQNLGWEPKGPLARVWLTKSV